MTAADIIAAASASLAADERLLADKASAFGSVERYSVLLPAEAEELLGRIESSRRLLADVRANPIKWTLRHEQQEAAAASGDVLGALFAG